MNELREALNLKIESPYLEEAYRAALSDSDLPEWLTEGYIRALRDELGLLPRSIDTVLLALPHVAKSPELRLFVKVIYHILGKRVGFNSAFSAFEMLGAPEKIDELGYGAALMFPIIAHLRPYRDTLLLRGIDEDVIRDTLFWIDSFISTSSEKKGAPYLSLECFRAYSVAIYSNHLIIGRLRFELYPNSVRNARVFKSRSGEYALLMDNVTLHKTGRVIGSYGCTDTDGSYYAEVTETKDGYSGLGIDAFTRLAKREVTTLPRDEWTPVYTSGDAAIKIHIPHGGRLDKKAVEDAFSRAREIFTRCYPEYNFTAFVIICWMLAPELSEILPEESNIIAFQNNFITYPVKSDATGVFLYVFDKDIASVDELDLSLLPEDNTLRRGIKKMALEGRFIHQFGGYMPF